ncbi:MAG: branched-chain amino acid ABC transporter substrate-binding protein [Gammaproteobacteria bacterium]
MNRSSGLIAALLIAIASIAACSKQPADRGSAETVVKIGSVAPLTGPQAHLGKDNDNGARLAMDEINAAGFTLGGKKARIELISEDDQADPRTATIVAQKFVDNGVAGVIGHLNSGATIPASKIYHDAGIPEISPSATAIAYTAQGFDTAFRVMTNDEQQGKVLGQFAVQKLGAKRIAIIDDRTAYGQGLADEFEKSAKTAGAQIVAREFTSDRSTDFMAILTSIKGKNPQLVFYGGMDAQAGPMAKQMKQLGLNAQLLGGDGAQTTEFLKLAGADAEGVIASSPGLPLTAMPGGQAFKDKFTARYGAIQNYAPYAYDALQVMVAAMRRADSADPKKYLPELSKTDYKGVTGHIRFDAKGDVAGGSVTLYKVDKGAWQVLETVQSGQ